MAASTSLVVVDACSLINLIATGRAEELLEGLGLRLVATPRVLEEVRFLSNPPNDEGVRVKVPIDLSELIRGGHLMSQVLPEGAQPLFILAAEQLPDNDASVIALAGTLDVPLVSDDGKIRRIARELLPSVTLRTTLGIIRLGCVALSLPRQDELRIAYNLRWRGNFLPPRDDPDADWFMTALARDRDLTRL